jgi:hypothetical protein
VRGASRTERGGGAGEEMSHGVGKAEALVKRLQELATVGRIYPPTTPRKGEDVTADQIPVFAELLVELAKELDKAQKKIEYLTWAITILTAVLVIDALLRFFTGH